jgi:glycosyltransferase involved in cell wall biosynthesis
VRIWHVDTLGTATAVDGVAAGLWVLAGAQAELGHDVVLFVRTAPSGAARARAADAGFELARMDRSPRVPDLFLRPYRRADRPDIVHFHGVWMPYHAVMSYWLRSRGWPYVVTTHGGLGPEVLARKRRRRALYVRLFEGPHLRGAVRAVTTVAGEVDQVRRVAGPGCRAISIPWPADISALTDKWEPDGERPTAVFLGRFDVYQKGLDRLADMARLCPEISFAVYGNPPLEGDATLLQLLATMPGNMSIHGPVHGAEKQDVLARATVYVQPSRFEGFSLSVVDALLVGTPVVASEHLGLVRELVEHGAGGALPSDTTAAARYLRELMADRARLEEWSRHGPAFARTRFDPGTSAAAYVSVYEEALGRVGQRAER